uniref:Uncharacterized protein n=1 Tax=Amphimedon queenslandica TaxID=400682 RepID=A0A1X7V022_AMPQE
MLLSKESKALFLLYLLVSVQAVYGDKSDNKDTANHGKWKCEVKEECPKGCIKFNSSSTFERILSKGYSVLKVTISGVVVVVATSHVLSWAGFTTAGIAAGSYAASWMSYLAPTAGGLFATIQSFAAGGISLVGKAFLFGVGGSPIAIWDWLNSDAEALKNQCCCPTDDP